MARKGRRMGTEKWRRRSRIPSPFSSSSRWRPVSDSPTTEWEVRPQHYWSWSLIPTQKGNALSSFSCVVTLLEVPLHRKWDEKWWGRGPRDLPLPRLCLFLLLHLTLWSLPCRLLPRQIQDHFLHFHRVRYWTSSAVHWRHTRYRGGDSRDAASVS